MSANARPHGGTNDKPHGGANEKPHGDANDCSVCIANMLTHGSTDVLANTHTDG